MNACCGVGMRTSVYPRVLWSGHAHICLCASAAEWACAHLFIRKCCGMSMGISVYPQMLRNEHGHICLSANAAEWACAHLFILRFVSSCLFHLIWKEDINFVPDRLWSPTSLLYGCQRIFPGGKTAAGLNLTTHLHLVPRLRMLSTPPVPPPPNTWRGA
jgi:hypothetical protein